MRLFKLTLRRRLLIISGLVFSLGASAVVGANVMLMTEAAREEADARIDALLSGYSTDMRRRVEAVATAVEAMTASVEATMTRADADRRLLGDMVRAAVPTLRGILGIALTYEPNAAPGGPDAGHLGRIYANQDGRMAAYFYISGDGSVAVENMAMGDASQVDLWYSPAIARNASFLSDPFLYPIEGVDAPMVSYSGVVQRGGVAVGAVTADIDLTGMARQLAEVRPFGAGALYLLGGDNHWIVPPSPELLGQPADADWLSVIEAGLIGDTVRPTAEGAQLYRSTRVAFNGVDERWTLVLSVPNASVYAAVEEATIASLGLAVVLLTATLLAVGVGSTAFTKPIEAIIGATRRLADGALDAEIPGEKRADELGDLARALAVFAQNGREMIRFQDRLRALLRRARKSARDLDSVRDCEPPATIEEDLRLSSAQVDRALEDLDSLITAVSASRTAAETARAEAERLAWTDTLTGLGNRHSLLSNLRAALDSADGERVFLLLIDLDRFKQVNDTYGHEAGDAVLTTIAHRIQGLIGGRGRGFRLGGDEFAVIVDARQSTSLSAVCDLAAELIEAIQGPVLHANRSLFVGASIGIGVSPDNAENGVELLRITDIALYEAKNAGRRQYRLYEEAVDRRAQLERRLEDDLRLAVERDELVMHFQPLVAGAANQVVGAEALLRWRTPQNGLLQPDQFIKILERSDMVFEIGEWVLLQGWRRIERWAEMFPDQALGVSVNVSARQFFDEKFIELLQDLALSNPDLVPRLELEITEGMMIQNMERAVGLMNRIGEMGFPIAIDDFGTGYSSIYYLAKLPVSKLKIDKSFLWGDENDKTSQSIVLSIITLGHTLGLKVTAEGVETASQEAFLRANGCDILQGFRFGKPLTDDDFETMVAGAAPGSITRSA